MSATQKHKGIEYKVESRGHDKWEWTYYPKIEKGQKESGKITGSYLKASTECRRAIDQFLGANSN
jgi:hypothetical protein